MTRAYGTRQLNVEQEALSGTAEQIVPARPSRKRITIRNLDASISVYVGHDATVGPTTGMLLKAEESITLETTAAVWMEAASGTPAISFVEEYN